MTIESLIVYLPAAAVIVLPFILVRREAWSAEVTPDRFRVLARGYERTLRAIKDLEFDQQVGSLSAEEHARLRAEYKERAVALRRAMEEWRLAAVRRIAEGKRVSLSKDELTRLEGLVRKAREKAASAGSTAPQASSQKSPPQ